MDDIGAWTLAFPCAACAWGWVPPPGYVPAALSSEDVSHRLALGKVPALQICAACGSIEWRPLRAGRVQRRPVRAWWRPWTWFHSGKDWEARWVWGEPVFVRCSTWRREKPHGPQEQNST